MKTISLFLITVAITACAGKDQQFCDCLATSKKMNELAHKLIVEGTSPAKAKELLALKKRKSVDCDAYKTLDGKEMMVKKQACAQ